MCIIIIKDNKKLIKSETLMASAMKNQDGLGVLWLDKWEITYHDSEDYMILKTHRPFIAHFRYATIGEVSKANCHPFNIDKNNVLFQNGTIHGLGSKKKTDTQHMAEILSDLPRKRWREVLEMNDSRFVTADLKNKKYQVYNKEDWTTRNKIMYSKDNVLDLTLIGVYGTLKKGFSNYWNYLRGATHIGSGETVEKYPMIIRGVPFLNDNPGVGHHVDIDLFLVDKHELDDIDMLEGHPNWYERKRAEVITDKGKIFLPYIYFNNTQGDGVYHKSYGENIIDYHWNGMEYRNKGWDYVDDYCECQNPQFISEWGEEYCDICYGERPPHNINQTNFNF